MTACPPVDSPSSTSPAYNTGAPTRSQSTLVARSASNATSPQDHLTTCECRPPWREDFCPEWTRFPIARMHYTKTTGLWTLYWRDRNLKYHRYDPLDPSTRVQDLLDYLDERADPIFWG